MSQLDWNATIESIRESLPQTQFQNWFRPVEFLRLEDSSVVLGVPSRFHEEWLRKHYDEKIRHAIRKNCGSDFQLEFEILIKDENVEASLSKSVPPSPPVSPTGRPHLRIVDPAEGEVSEEPPVTKPDVPQFPRPFWDFGYNRSAFHFARLFAEAELTMNPLIVIASVGMGKTHCLSAISQWALEKNPGLRIRYTDSEAFTAEMVQSFKGDSFGFKNKYRFETDLLLFDDIQGVQGRVRTQEELVHIFNEIVARGGRVVFTSQVPIHRLEKMNEALKSRLQSGVLTEIKTPSYEDKLQLLSQVAMHQEISIEEPTLRSLADKGYDDVREFIGTFLRLHLQARLENTPFNQEFLSREGLTREGPKETTTLEEIITLVEHTFAVNRTDMISKSRKQSITWARQIAMYLARHFTLLPLEEIGKIFGRDHATVIHAFQKVTEAMESHPSRRYEVEFLKGKLQNQNPRGQDDLPI